PQEYLRMCPGYLLGPMEITTLPYRCHMTTMHPVYTQRRIAAVTITTLDGVRYHLYVRSDLEETADRLSGVASQAARRARCSALASGCTSKSQPLAGSAPNVTTSRCRRSRRAMSTVACASGRYCARRASHWGGSTR